MSPVVQENMVKFTKPIIRLMIPIEKILKSKTTKAIKEIKINENKVFAIEESIKAKIYSIKDKGVINILLRFLDHIFQRAPTDIEY